jgi:hypothetical protein
MRRVKSGIFKNKKYSKNQAKIFFFVPRDAQFFILYE